MDDMQVSSVLDPSLAQLSSFLTPNTWTSFEDTKLLDTISSLGGVSQHTASSSAWWNAVATGLSTGKDGRACEERWRDVLGGGNQMGNVEGDLQVLGHGLQHNDELTDADQQAALIAQLGSHNYQDDIHVSSSSPNLSSTFASLPESLAALSHAFVSPLLSSHPSTSSSLSFPLPNPPPPPSADPPIPTQPRLGHVNTSIPPSSAIPLSSSIHFEPGKRLWKPEEDKKLLSLVDQNGPRNWAIVARMLGTGRTSPSCCARWCRLAGPEKETVETPERSDSGSPAATVTVAYQGITKGKRQKWKKWTPEEDAELTSLVGQHGAKSWGQIASLMSTERSDDSCCGRWTHYLVKKEDERALKVGGTLSSASKLNKNASNPRWTEEEDSLLRRLRAQRTNWSWSDLGNKLNPKRTAGSCRARWVQHIIPRLGEVGDEELEEWGGVLLEPPSPRERKGRKLKGKEMDGKGKKGKGKGKERDESEEEEVGGEGGEEDAEGENDGDETERIVLALQESTAEAVKRVEEDLVGRSKNALGVMLDDAAGGGPSTSKEGSTSGTARSDGAATVVEKESNLPLPSTTTTGTTASSNTTTSSAPLPSAAVVEPLLDPALFDLPANDEVVPSTGTNGSDKEAMVVDKEVEKEKEGGKDGVEPMVVEGGQPEKEMGSLEKEQVEEEEEEDTPVVVAERRVTRSSGRNTRGKGAGGKATEKSKGKGKAKGKGKQKEVVEEEEEPQQEQEDEDEADSGPDYGYAQSDEAEDDDEDDEDDDYYAPPRTASSGRGRKRGSGATSGGPPRRKPRASLHRADDDAGSSTQDGDEEMVVRPRKKSRKSSTPKLSLPPRLDASGHLLSSAPLAPHITPWTIEEEQQLKDLVEVHGRKNWTHLAEVLGTGRTAASASARWHRLEGTTLKAAMPDPQAPLIVGDSSSTAPTTVATPIITKPIKQKPRNNSKAWTPADDAELRANVARLGRNSWAKVGAEMTRPRSEYAASSRWYEYVLKNPVPDEDNSDLMGPKRRWTPDEDRELRRLIDMHGPYGWTAIGKEMKGNRPGTSCRLRWINYLSKQAKPEGDDADKTPRATSVDKGKENSQNTPISTPDLSAFLPPLPALPAVSLGPVSSSSTSSTSISTAIDPLPSFSAASTHALSLDLARHLNLPLLSGTSPITTSSILPALDFSQFTDPNLQQILDSLHRNTEAAARKAAAGQEFDGLGFLGPPVVGGSNGGLTDGLDALVGELAGSSSSSGGGGGGGEKRVIGDIEVGPAQGPDLEVDDGSANKRRRM